MKKDFKEGQLVAYAPTDQNGLVYKVQIGKVKHMNADHTAVFVYYHAGSTAACTPVQHVYPIENDGYLTIKNAFTSLD